MDLTSVRLNNGVGGGGQFVMHLRDVLINCIGLSDAIAFAQCLRVPLRHIHHFGMAFAEKFFANEKSAFENRLGGAVASLEIVEAPEVLQIGCHGRVLGTLILPADAERLEQQWLDSGQFSAATEEVSQFSQAISHRRVIVSERVLEEIQLRLNLEWVRLRRDWRCEHIKLGVAHGKVVQSIAIHGSLSYRGAEDN